MAKKKPIKKPLRKKKVVKKSTDLYFKGKRLNKFFKGAVEQTARIKNVDISTPAKLKKFYESNKDAFGNLFDIGLETQLKGSSTVFNQFDVAKAHEHEFMLEQHDKTVPITAERAKFELAKLEQQLNVMFDSTGVEYSYKMKLDGSVIVSVPSEQDLEDIQDEPVEFINDFLSDYGIKIYTSDPSKRKKFIENEPKRKTYSDRVKNRFKQFRKEYNKTRKKTTKSKTKRKKR
jgi:chemotaxis receptor (MCP) glutamine deamidase CheD